MILYDTIIIGAGAAGLSAAAVALGQNKSVLVFEMGHTPGRKILASGGGRCNITNMAADASRYFGQNPDFVRSAISRISPTNVIEWATEHGIELVEKNPGQYFCKDGSNVVLNALINDAKGADIIYDTKILDVKKSGDVFFVNGKQSKSLLLATGGISFPGLGVSDQGYKIAKTFGHKIIPVRPALCGLVFDYFPKDLSGISHRMQIDIGKYTVIDSGLFTHAGIGGPVAYRASLYDMKDDIKINLLPEVDLEKILRDMKHKNGNKPIGKILTGFLPARLAKWIVQSEKRNIADMRDAEITDIVQKICNIKISATKIKYHGMNSAEVVRGGVDTRDISSKTMESKLCPGLFFAGEIIDIAGDLGGFNLQWAWSSGRIAGQNL